MKKGLFLFLLTILNVAVQSQTSKPINDTLNYKVIYGLAVKGEIASVLSLLAEFKPVRPADSAFKANFEDRFKFETDRTGYFIKPDTSLNPMHRIFQEYWRKGLIENNNNFDSLLIQNTVHFLQAENRASLFTRQSITKETVPDLFSAYIKSKGFFCTDFGKTGKFYDFIVWKKSVPLQYDISLINEKISVTVNFLNEFASLGWLEYARLGNYYPGGWATKHALYCVAKGYDTASEKFKINFLKHEAQHFADFARFPNLSSNDLEYRGKLVELYYNEAELYNRIEYFINNAKNDSSNSHPFANYHVISNMSKVLFHKDWESDLSKWKVIPRSRIHACAKKLLEENNKRLISLGKNVTTSF